MIGNPIPAAAVESALDLLTAAARAEQLPVSSFADIARIRLDFRVTNSERQPTPDEAAFHAWIAAAHPWLMPAGADYRNMQQAFIAGRQSATPAEFEGVPV